MKHRFHLLALVICVAVIALLGRGSQAPNIAIDGVRLGMTLSEAQEHFFQDPVNVGTPEYRAVMLGNTLVMLDSDQRVVGIAGQQAVVNGSTLQPGEYIGEIDRILEGKLLRNTEPAGFGTLYVYCQDQKHADRYITGEVPTRYFDLGVPAPIEPASQESGRAQ